MNDEEKAIEEQKKLVKELREQLEFAHMKIDYLEKLNALMEKEDKRKTDLSDR
ncbi:MAG: hypothetical protein Q3959_06575 [Limosilactobacillus sp.]|uniref:hypothetical protein n=1 Tax=Limosilactobacillus sp. TaxID=2773925 RepID=UPI00270658C7|nr:hypothetical protein [Limosilactobacillus sp.]